MYLLLFCFLIIVSLPCLFLSLFVFFFNDTAPTELYTLSLHDALPIRPGPPRAAAATRPPTPGCGRPGPRRPAKGPARRPCQGNRQLPGRSVLGRPPRIPVPGRSPRWPRPRRRAGHAARPPRPPHARPARSPPPGAAAADRTGEDGSRRRRAPVRR